MTDKNKLDKLNLLTAGDFRAFLYDCDGTLADNMQAHKDSYVKTAAEYGFNLDPALIDELAGWPTVAVVNEIGRRYEVALDPEAFGSRKGRIFFDEYITHTRPIPYVVDHLKQHAGRVKIGVVSGGRRVTVERTLSILGIAGLVDTIVCAGETPRGKPFPDPFLKAAAELHVAPEHCMVFEDGDPGIQAAMAAGMAHIRIDKL
ncbi:HAD family hydrolase [Taibaiella koreensis]|uniref:HAD family hydrolase n=1 Tax=Taibaiella koreensis TaxID=1268548 RepID=UPI001F0A0076|nr:HAD family phosphatase [Taibaiella koreensis]